ncbi:MAG: hypothetical protein U0793_22930 [Gemmataceae bacterium]
MAVSFQQQSRVRKFIYLGIIFALFTVGLLHRRFIIEAQADYLELREVARGEAELSGAAVRLLLTGSSGLATTYLWSYALDLQEKHQFNRLKLVVDSITKLQPHFSTPWIFQSWNLAFNVAVEFDSPRDKYFYVSEGLTLLSRGERANRGRIEFDPSDPRSKIKRGNPDMRWFLGFAYQLKMGTSDENTTMRCLLDMSCINPAARDPKKFLVERGRGKEVGGPFFVDFAQKNPRLVRRLHEGLGLDPREVVQFLEDNAEVPGRFVYDNKKMEYVLRDWKDQFPILPVENTRDTVQAFNPGMAGHPGPPDPRTEQLTQETTDVFLMSRTWFEYAQLPLPPPTTEISFDKPEIDAINQRLPQRGWVIIFRGYPPRGQFYIAETLQTEGFFDDDGWNIRSWLENAKPALRWDEGDTTWPENALERVGVEPKYHSHRAWGQAFVFYKDFGEKNGIYLAPGLRADLEKKAETFRQSFNPPLAPGQTVNRPAAAFQGPLAEGFEAHTRLASVDIVLQTTNYNDFLYQAQAESAEPTVRARKWIFDAKKLRATADNPGLALELYQKAIPLWRDVALRHPRYAVVTTMQEELYGTQLDYIFDLQKQNVDSLQKTCAAALDIGRISSAFTFPGPAAEALKSTSGGYFRKARGPLEFLELYRGDAPETIQAALVVAQALAQPTPLITPSQYGMISTDYAIVRALPTLERARDWQPLITEEAIRSVRDLRHLPPLTDENP